MSNLGWRRAGLYTVLTFLTVAALGILAASYIARNISITRTQRAGGGDDVSIRTPGGQINIRSRRNLDPAALGVPIYPDAKRANEGKGATFQWTSLDGKEEKAFAVAGNDYVTRDSPAQVLAWYRRHLPNWVIVEDRTQSNARFELSEGGYKRIVAVHEKSDGTHIGVATVGEPASN